MQISHYFRRKDSIAIMGVKTNAPFFVAGYLFFVFSISLYDCLNFTHRYFDGPLLQLSVHYFSSHSNLSFHQYLEDLEELYV
jgi:hypothetical protein